MRENFGFVTHTRPALGTLWHRCRLLNCHSGFCAHCFALCAECGTDSVWGQPQMEPLWTPYRDVLMPSKSRAKRTLLGQGICSKGGGEASSADRECGCASIQRGGHPPTKRLVRAVPGGHRRFPTGYNSTDLQVARRRATSTYWYKLSISMPSRSNTNHRTDDPAVLSWRSGNRIPLSDTSRRPTHSRS
jgi:hypothetical protein